MTNTDRIEKKVLLKASRARVWRAVSDSEEFGQWFRVALEGSFEAGAIVRGRLKNPKFEHLTLEMHIEKVEPERYFAYRWRPNAIDLNFDYSAEPMTLVEFELADAEGGTLLTISESGFDALPDGRRSIAFRANDEGWGIVTTYIEQYVEKS